ncbi:Quinate/shikimate 5-dehydrogenase/glutamyl-tRNA reductase [Penicillium robsamsonii]|uniref:Quinate/shikimate 5-dehydrogenase/glutamyl-tRNA reductase n=1 Tax=Penicillium robsamsonii TaxID=1792511 RepID=UPI002547DA3B|nr:Quinate/shikimate 5-dehydrogenase/glutamyl-tRNA reductase [Penicillium robsamsonii]KAJ5817852.1 Quinate/shikimate 5-dehydrogenase/glutamyl-tRNA reductase [Penicillium robsamsonii]
MFHDRVLVWHGRNQACCGGCLSNLQQVIDCGTFRRGEFPGEAERFRNIVVHAIGDGTPLLTVAQHNQGWDTVTGVEVLLAQAFDQFMLWAGFEPPRDIMAEVIVVLVGERATMAKGGML